MARGILLCSLWAPVVRGPESQLRSCSVTWDLSSPTRDQTCAPCIARRSLTPQFSHSHVHLFATPWTTAGQASLSITISQNLLKLMSIKLVMPSNHLIFFHLLLLLPSIFPSIRVFSNESVLCIRWPRYWSFSFSPSNEYPGLISFRMDWLDLFAVQGTLKSVLQ